MRSTELRQFIEDFALVLTDAGMQRMGARAFGALLSSESGTLTAREIAGVLDVSPAAVSGAVKYLEQAQLVRRMRLTSCACSRYLTAPLTAAGLTSRTPAISRAVRVPDSELSSAPKARAPIRCMPASVRTSAKSSMNWRSSVDRIGTV